MKITYKDCSLRAEGLEAVAQANKIITEYQEQGFVLTLRQLYYQFVSRDLISNDMRSYKRLGHIIDEGRLSGLIDWNSIEDRTRKLSKLSTWDSPSEIIDACAKQFMIDLWATQLYQIEVWIEKEALAGVVETVCEKWRVPFLSCRGYTSQSEMWRAGRRLLAHIKNNKKILILHLGDHDPSGIDMSRDIQKRLDMFIEREHFEFNRIALNMDQIERLKPPPNPAKSTDTRFQAYRAQFGDESWELDALEPKLITGLISKNVTKKINKKEWYASEEKEKSYKEDLERVSEELE